MARGDETGERVHITADALRDGSLIAAARLRASGDAALLSDAEIEARPGGDAGRTSGG